MDTTAINQGNQLHHQDAINRDNQRHHQDVRALNRADAVARAALPIIPIAWTQGTVEINPSRPISIRERGNKMVTQTHLMFGALFSLIGYFLFQSNKNQKDLATHFDGITSKTGQSITITAVPETRDPAALTEKYGCNPYEKAGGATIRAYIKKNEHRIVSTANGVHEYIALPKHGKVIFIPDGDSARAYSMTIFEAAKYEDEHVNGHDVSVHPRIKDLQKIKKFMDSFGDCYEEIMKAGDFSQIILDPTAQTFTGYYGATFDTDFESGKEGYSIKISDEHKKSIKNRYEKENNEATQETPNRQSKKDDDNNGSSAPNGRRHRHSPEPPRSTTNTSSSNDASSPVSSSTSSASPPITATTLSAASAHTVSSTMSSSNDASSPVSSSTSSASPPITATTLSAAIAHTVASTMSSSELAEATSTTERKTETREYAEIASATPRARDIDY